METQYSWKTKLFSKRFEIYRHETLAGELRKEGWSRRVRGELNDKKILFETKGIFKYTTDIINLQDNSIVGQVKYHKWKAKSTIVYDEREYQWQFDNFFRSKWSLGNENGNLIKFHARGFKGSIVSYTKDDILILTGFFVRNFMNQRSAEIAAVS
jgi:hypothetical protein